MNKFFRSLIAISILASCSNTPELETGEIKTLAILKQAFQQSNQPKKFIDARLLLDREQIDKTKAPVLFVELQSGQNGTLIPYPGQGVGKTWLGADGATITLDRGILKATRGMGDDMMGSFSSMPNWSKIKPISGYYSRKISYIDGNNKISKRTLQCVIKKYNQQEFHEIWGLKFHLMKFEETCKKNGSKIKNIYYLDNEEIVRKSYQYHSDTVGYITTERLDR